MFTSPPAPKRGTSFESDVQAFPDSENGNSPQGFKWLLLLLFGLTLISGLIIWNSSKEIAPGVIETSDGDLALSPERQAKLLRELEEIDNAVQYALLASQSGLYPCYTCPNGQITISLNELEVWRYGVTRKGEKARYPDGNYGAPKLLFVVEFEGDYAECLKMEKTKIYNYPFLPEARARTIILPRPPGNKYDH